MKLDLNSLVVLEKPYKIDTHNFRTLLKSQMALICSLMSLLNEPNFILFSSKLFRKQNLKYWCGSLTDRASAWHQGTGNQTPVEAKIIKLLKNRL